MQWKQDWQGWRGSAVTGSRRERVVTLRPRAAMVPDASWPGGVSGCGLGEGGGRFGGGVPGISGHCMGSQIVFRMEFV